MEHEIRPKRTMPRAALRLALWRETIGMTQVEAARVFGVSTSSYSKYEVGDRAPARKMATKIDRLTRGAVPVSAWDDHVEITE